MNFATHYTNASHFLGQSVDISFSPQIITVIPALDEPLIFETLESILSAKPSENVLIIVVVNYSERVSDYRKSFNRRVFDLLGQFAKRLEHDKFSILPLFYPDMPRKHAGAGLARKVGMDTAIEIFARTNNQNGIITSLDADCRIDSNYFESITAHFSQYADSQVATINFWHNRTGLTPSHKWAIDQYELYLRYFVLACRWAGFTDAFQTIGSCFAVRALGYVKNGGMSKKHAGEDFYFLQKMFPNGKNRVLSNTRVYPSSRLSKRVPFGTGPALCDIVEKQSPYCVYAFDAFDDLRAFYGNFDKLYANPSIDNVFPEPLRMFFKHVDFESKLHDAHINSSTPQMFTKRLLSHFNAFQLVKYLNYVHDKSFYRKGDVMEETIKALMAMDMKCSSEVSIDDLLTLAEASELS